jgi:biotin transport system substrate-specific component
MGAPGLARLLGPTGGYILAYPVAAAVAGRFGAGKASYVTRSLAAMAGILVLYLGGLAQLAVITGNLGLAAIMGVVPFVAADAVKALVAGALSGRRRGI